jgi:hypothetical protein
MKKIIYIAGAITGTDDADMRFATAESNLKADAHVKGIPTEVINPYEVNNTLGFLPHDVIMKICFSLIDQADELYFIKGWEESRGANQEYGYAFASGKKIIFQK